MEILSFGFVLSGFGRFTTTTSCHHGIKKNLSGGGLPFTNTLSQMFNCDCSHWELRTLIFFVCSVAFGITAYIALSIPFNTLSIYSYIAEIQFNEEMLSGSVNQFPVQNLTTLRVSLAMYIFCKSYVQLGLKISFRSSWETGKDNVVRWGCL